MLNDLTRACKCGCINIYVRCVVLVKLSLRARSGKEVRGFFFSGSNAAHLPYYAGKMLMVRKACHTQWHTRPAIPPTTPRVITICISPFLKILIPPPPHTHTHLLKQAIDYKCAQGNGYGLLEVEGGGGVARDVEICCNVVIILIKHLLSAKDDNEQLSSHCYQPLTA